MEKQTKKYIIEFFIGAAIGIANLIPGVSGGTIALITGVLMKMLDSVKKLNIHAAKLLFRGKFKEFSDYINLKFLGPIFLGLGFSIFTTASLFSYLLEFYPIQTWSLFFGLIVASVIFVFKRIQQVNIYNILLFIIASGLTPVLILTNPASPNESFLYVFVCGIVGISGMILPGISGSFILMLLGIYKPMLTAIKTFQLDILIPIGLGTVVGFFGFSYVVSYVFKKFHDETIAVLSGFILGSLVFLWPWKTENMVDGINTGYSFFMPSFNTETISAIALMIVGFVIIYAMEVYAEKKDTAPQIREKQ